MQVVLRSDVQKVGKRGDILEVADGFARNFLIPRGHAIAATEGITAQAKAMRAARDRVDARNKAEAEAKATKLVGITVRISERASAEGKLYGSVTDTEIVRAIKEQSGLEVDRRQVEGHESIRTVGEHQVPVKLHADVQVSLAVEVSPAE